MGYFLVHWSYCYRLLTIFSPHKSIRFVKWFSWRVVNHDQWYLRQRLFLSSKVNSHCVKLNGWKLFDTCHSRPKWKVSNNLNLVETTRKQSLFDFFFIVLGARFLQSSAHWYYNVFVFILVDFMFNRWMRILSLSICIHCFHVRKG